MLTTVKRLNRVAESVGTLARTHYLRRLDGFDLVCHARLITLGVIAGAEAPLCARSEAQAAVGHEDTRSLRWREAQTAADLKLLDAYWERLVDHTDPADAAAWLGCELWDYTQRVEFVKLFGPTVEIDRLRAAIVAELPELAALRGDAFWRRLLQRTETWMSATAAAVAAELGRTAADLERVRRSAMAAERRAA